MISAFVSVRPPTFTVRASAVPLLSTTNTL
jgi:hypothetical protein